MRELGLPLDNKSSITTPGTKMNEDGESEPLDAAAASRYRSITARANFLSQDRADVQCSTKELSRHMSAPTKRAWEALMRLGKYLRAKPRYVQLFPWQNATSTCFH